MFFLSQTIQERDGAFEKAVKTYQTALKNNPKNVSLALKIAQLYDLRLNRPLQAMQIAKEAHGLLPDDPRINLMLGRLAFKNNDYKWAASLLQEAARSLPNEADVIYDLAWSHYSLGQVPEAEAKMKLVSNRVRLTPDTTNSESSDPHEYTQAAKQFLEFIAASKDPRLVEQSARQGEHVLSAESNYVPALIICALAREQQQKFKEAAQFFQRALDIYPAFAPAAQSLDPCP